MQQEQSSKPAPREREATRLEAFSDGVLAVIITIMVLELRPPDGINIEALKGVLPGLLIYILSFTFIGIYWNNHHHLLRATGHISAGIMWANLHLLFWLSLVPLVTEWVGKYDQTPLPELPAVAYGAVGFMAGIAFYILTLAIRAANKDARVAQLLQEDIKPRISLLFYAAGMVLAYVVTPLAYAAYALVSILWFIPDRRYATSEDEQD